MIIVINMVSGFINFICSSHNIYSEGHHWLCFHSKPTSVRKLLYFSLCRLHKLLLGHRSRSEHFWLKLKSVLTQVYSALSTWNSQSLFGNHGSRSPCSSSSTCHREDSTSCNSSCNNWNSNWHANLSYLLVSEDRHFLSNIENGLIKMLFVLLHLVAESLQAEDLDRLVPKLCFRNINIGWSVVSSVSLRITITITLWIAISLWVLSLRRILAVLTLSSIIDWYRDRN